MATNDEEVTVWVGGLDSQVTTELLWELFIQAGPLLEVKIPMDRETGEQRPFAFIAFKHPISGPYAERLFNGIKLYDKIIRVRYKGSQKFEQNKYHELYDGLLERLSTEQPEKYNNIFDEVARARSTLVTDQGNLYDEESSYDGYSSRQRDYHDNRHIRDYRQDSNPGGYHSGGGGVADLRQRIYPEYQGKYAQYHGGGYSGNQQRHSRDRYRGSMSRY